MSVVSGDPIRATGLGGFSSPPNHSRCCGYPYQTLPNLLETCASFNLLAHSRTRHSPEPTSPGRSDIFFPSRIVSFNCATARSSPDFDFYTSASTSCA